MVRSLSGGGVRLPVRWDLEAQAIGPIWNLQPSAGVPMPDFARSSHSQQTFRVTGTITVDGVDHRVAGIGCNDHSRGSRDLTHFAGDQWVVGIMPGYTFHVINGWKQDQTPVLTVGAWFDDRGYRSVTARRHAVHTISNEPKAFDLVIDDRGTERVFALEVLHGCTISLTQQHDNLNGVGWDLPGDTVVLNESPVRITADTGDVGYGHLERSLRLDQAGPVIGFKGLVVPTTPSIARGMVEIDRQTLPDPADRTIAATAVAMGLPAVSSDDRLRKAGDRGVLQVVR